MESIDLVQYTDFVSRIVAKSIPEYDVEDVSQDVMEDLVRALPSFRGDSSFQTFLFRIVKRDICDYYRKWERERRIVPQCNFPTSCDPWDMVHDKLELEDITNRIPQKNAAVLRDMLDGYGEGEITRKTGLTYDTLHGRYRSALIYARRVIEYGTCRFPSSR